MQETTPRLTVLQIEAYNPDMTFSAALRRWLYLIVASERTLEDWLDEVTKLEALMDSKVAGGSEAAKFAVRCAGGKVC